VAGSDRASKVDVAATRFSDWKLVYTKHAQKDAEKLAPAGMKTAVRAYLNARTSSDPTSRRL
jgi:hypothetical protein